MLKTKTKTKKQGNSLTFIFSIFFILNQGQVNNYPMRERESDREK